MSRPATALIRPSHPFAYDPPTLSGIKGSIPTRLGDAYVPHTLSLLYNATSRGLAHKPTRNLRGSSHHRGDWLRSAHERHSIPWRLTGDPVHIKLRKRQTDGNEPGELVWNMVGKVRMAEGRDQPTLGRAPSCQRRSFRNLSGLALPA